MENTQLVEEVIATIREAMDKAVDQYIGTVNTSERKLILGKWNGLSEAFVIAVETLANSEKEVEK